MYAKIVILGLAFSGALAAPSLVAAPAAFASPFVAAPAAYAAAPAALVGPPVVTSRSSQVIARNHNALAAPILAAPAAPLLAAPAAPLVAAPAPLVAAPAPLAAPFAYSGAVAPWGYSTGPLAFPGAAPAYYF